MRHSAALLRRIPGINHRLNRWIVLTSNRSNWPSPMKALSRRDLLKHRLNAAVKHSKSLTLLTDELALSIEAIHNELMGIHGWSDEDAALSLVDTLRGIEHSLMEALVLVDGSEG